MVPRLALAHDFLVRFGGAEKVLKIFHERHPEAPMYTLAADPALIREHFPKAHLHTSWLQSAPRLLRRPDRLAPLIPAAVESFTVDPCDILVSSGGFTKGLITKPGTTHFSYVHSPVRYLWDWTHEYFRERRIGPLAARGVQFVFHYLRLWDRQAAQRPDILIASSHTSRERIAKYYRRDAPVIYPPVRPLAPLHTQHSTFHTPHSTFHIPTEPYDLIVSALRPYKRVDLAVRAWTRIGRRLVIVGDGPLLRTLRRMAGPTVTLSGWQPDPVVARLLASARTFILPAQEDFGMAAVEAMMAGVPVLALRAGGATETVIEGVTGEFFDDPLPEVLLDGLRRLERNRPRYLPAVIAAHAGHFSEERFWREWEHVLAQPTANVIGYPR